MVHAVGVTKVHGKHVALRDVNIHIERGEFVFLVGPSGAGKSTLLRLLYREERPTSGEIWVNNYCLNVLRSKHVPQLRRSLGVVFQDFDHKLLPSKTIFDNVAFALVVTEASRREISRRVPAVIEMVGLSGKERLYPHQLSGGERQRVSLARAMVNQPVLLLADEPTGNLDPETAMEIMSLLVEINDRGTTVLVATHAEHIVNAFRKRVIALKEGCLVRDEERGLYAAEA